MSGFQHWWWRRIPRVRFVSLERLRSRRTLAKAIRARYGRQPAQIIARHLKRHALPSGAGQTGLRAIAQDIAQRLMDMDAASVERDVEVSVIVPVFNALPFTLSCIDSLLSHKSSYEFEIVVGNDRSTDETETLIRSRGRALRIVRNDGPKGFLGNCNFAANQATGRVLVFLNNDTIVLPGWLDGLVAPLMSDPTVGLTGSKIILANGKLQEAGSFVFANGRTARFGAKDDPWAPIYNNPRDADFISGASIALRTDIWRQLGGFDERFSPGYYEDADLAFRVRKAGLRVLYSPASAILHFGKLSFRTEAQALMDANRSKFVQIWRDELAKRPQWPGRDKRKAQAIIMAHELDSRLP